jgi:hypothetical protein
MQPASNTTLKKWLPLICILGGFALVVFSFVYYVFAVGFPIPVVKASRATPEQMSALNPPDPVASAMGYSGEALILLGIALYLFRLICWFGAKRHAATP